jgi:Ca-activated chloride channel family protein
VVIEGRSASGPFRQALAVDPRGPQDAVALRSLWARHRIESLGDQEALEGGDAYKARITELGLRYSLLTPYTSFIAVDQVVRNPTPGSGLKVDQPLPMPQGVSDQALGADAGAQAGATLGAEVPSTPEPELLGAVAVVLSMLAMLRRRARRNDPRRFTS